VSWRGEQHVFPTVAILVVTTILLPHELSSNAHLIVFHAWVFHMSSIMIKYLENDKYYGSVE
jgi:predicted amidohydrolase